MQHLPATHVFWNAQNKTHGRSVVPLSGDQTADIIVVGDGMAGLSCADTLADRGASVVLLEKDFCGAGASGKTSGFITPDSELELSDLIRNRGPEKAKQLWEFVSSGTERIRENIEGHGIDCDYQVQDSLFIANTTKGFSIVQHEHEGRSDLDSEFTPQRRFPINHLLQRAMGTPNSFALSHGIVKYFR